ncbi:GEVED domain-containing protein [Adhaeribacter radiodurans]|uniref:T9SS type A sorting domain-containing protein n=1 Tax=Adhaeribacter radiodurans TaxID=2745197 RepID=A0A7L7L4N1_9BACT|nr:GEVED domain-containing protein [Adhaeribacter radiodurans]QMU27545.1 T9SS type A sorting domain-containing protein [Adhaeribacter radiodurans]
MRATTAYRNQNNSSLFYPILLRTLLLLLAFTGIIPNLLAQDKEWDKTFGGTGDDYLPYIRQTNDGGYILGGWSNSEKGHDKSDGSRGGFDYWVIKLKADGSKAWDKTFGGTGDDLLTSLQPTSDGGYILGGFSYSENNNDKSGKSRGGADYWIVKLNAKGTKVWDQTLGGKGDDYCQYLIQTQDGGYMVGGYSNSNIDGEKSEISRGNYDYWIIKLNADSSLEWDKTIGGNADDKLTILQQTKDGGYVIGGYSNSENRGNKSEPSRGNTDYWVIKTDEAGIIDWDKTYGGYDFENLQFVQQTTDGGYILGGQSDSGEGGDKTQASRGGSDYWVLKLKPDGSKIWDKSYGGEGDDYLAALQQSNDGGCILGGSATYGKGGDKTVAGVGNLDFWLLKIKSDGSKVWDKTWGGKEDDLLNSIQVTQEGGYIMGGWSLSGKTGNKTEASRGGYDYWVVKMKDTENPEKPYCQPTVTYTCQDVDLYIANFTFHTLNNRTTGCEGKENGYVNFDPVVNLTTTVHAGQSYPIQLQSGPDHPQGFGIWIDFNNDGDFSDNGELVYTLAEPGNGTFSGTITIPASSTLGNRRLRVRTKYDSVFTEEESCADTEYGETEDYTITIAKAETTTQWNMRYGGSGNEGLLTLIRTTDGGYLTGGYSPSGISGDKTQTARGKNDYWIVKADDKGKKIWDKRFGGSDHEYLNRILQTLDGGYLLGGSSLSGISGDKTQDNRGDRDYWVVKVNAQGNKQWDKRYGGSGYDELKKVLLLPNGDYLLAGSSNSPASGDKTQESQGGTDFWLVKISSTGAKVWDQRYGGNLNDDLNGIISTPEGGFLLAGTTASGRSGDKTELSRGGTDFWLVRVDKDGTKLWDKRFGGSGQDELYSLGRTNSYIYLSGQSNSPANGDKSQGSQGGKDYWFLKIANNGTKIWDQRFGGSKNDELRGSIQTSDGGYLLAGYSFSDKSGNKSQDSQGGSDYWLVKTDKNGDYQWDKRYGGEEAEELRAIIEAPEGGYILGGKSASGVSGDRTQPSQGGTDFWLLKVAPNAAEEPIIATRESILPTESTTLTDSINLSVAPNPFAQKATVRFTLPETQTVTIKIYDSQGQEITTLFQGEAQANQTQELEWKAENQASGLYLLQVQTPTKLLRYKVIIAK